MGRKRGITREKAVLEKLYRDLTGHKCNEGYLYDYKQYGMGYRHWNFCRSAWLGEVSGLSGYEEGLSPNLKQNMTRFLRKPSNSKTLFTKLSEESTNSVTK